MLNRQYLEIETKACISLLHQVRLGYAILAVLVVQQRQNTTGIGPAGLRLSTGFRRKKETTLLDRHFFTTLLQQIVWTDILTPSCKDAALRTHTFRYAHNYQTVKTLQAIVAVTSLRSSLQPPPPAKKNILKHRGLILIVIYKTLEGHEPLITHIADNRPFDCLNLCMDVSHLVCYKSF